jgi:hypothetical protein
MAELTKSEAWKKFVEQVAERGVGNYFALPDADECDVEDLKTVITNETGAKRLAAVQVLYHKCMGYDRSFDLKAAGPICPAIAEVVEQGYPMAKWSQNAMSVWQRIDAERAANFVNAWVDRNGIPEAAVFRVTLDLSFGNNESLARLRRFAQNNHEAKLAGNAKLVLDRTAPAWSEKLKDYGRQWREKRDCRTLLYLTNQLVDARPRADAYIADIVAAMGEPDSATGSCYIYLTKPEFQGYLYLETDKNGKVTGWKLENC